MFQIEDNKIVFNSNKFVLGLNAKNKLEELNKDIINSLSNNFNLNPYHVLEMFYNDLMVTKNIDYGVGEIKKGMHFSLYHAMNILHEKRKRAVSDFEPSRWWVAENLYDNPFHFDMFELVLLEYRYERRYKIVDYLYKVKLLYVKSELKLIYDNNKTYNFIDDKRLNYDLNSLKEKDEFFINNNLLELPTRDFNKRMVNIYRFFAKWNKYYLASIAKENNFFYKKYFHFIKEESILIKEKIEEVERNLKKMADRSEKKIIYNFYDEPIMSTQVLTLPIHNLQMDLDPTVKNYDKIYPAISKYITLLRYHLKMVYKREILNREENIIILKNIQQKQRINKQLAKIEKKQFNYLVNQEIKEKMKLFKYERTVEITQKRTVHFHLTYNIDIFKIFGYTNDLIYSKNNTEFFYNKQQLIDKKHFSKEKWHYKKENNITIPTVNKLWDIVVRKEFKHLKKLNPKSQYIAVYYKNPNQFKKVYNVSKIKYDGIDKPGVKIEIINNKKKLRRVSANFCEKIAEYNAKYNSKKDNKEKFNRNIYINKSLGIISRVHSTKRLFQFSLSCKKLPIKYVVNYGLEDLKESSYQMDHINSYFNFEVEGRPFII